MPFMERVSRFLDKDHNGTLDFIEKWREVKHKFKSYGSENNWSLRARIKDIESFSDYDDGNEFFEELGDMNVEDEDGNEVPAIQNGLFAGQRYEIIREKCLAKRKLFVDRMFPPKDSSLYARTDSTKDDDVVWKRATSISEDARMFLEGATRFDINQGSLGDCWLLAAVANLTMCSDLFEKVVPKSQSFKEDYTGIFHFR